MSGPPIDITPDPPELFLEITSITPELTFGIEPFVVGAGTLDVLRGGTTAGFADGVWDVAAAVASGYYTVVAGTLTAAHTIDVPTPAAGLPFVLAMVVDDDGMPEVTWTFDGEPGNVTPLTLNPTAASIPTGEPGKNIQIWRMNPTDVGDGTTWVALPYTIIDPAGFATATQGALADTALQPGDPVTQAWAQNLAYTQTHGAYQILPTDGFLWHPGGSPAAYTLPSIADVDPGFMLTIIGNTSTLTAPDGAGVYNWDAGAGVAAGDPYTFVGSCHVILTGGDWGDGAKWIVLSQADTFATLAQGALADTAVQPGDLPTFGTAAAADVGDFVPSLGTDAFGLALLTKTTSAEVRSYIGLVLGTDVQAYHANLAGLAGVTSAADTLAYFTGAGGATALTTLTPFGRSLLDDATSTEHKATIGTPATPQPLAPFVGSGSNGYAYFIPGATGYIYGGGAGAYSQNRNNYELWEFDENTDIIPAVHYGAVSAAGKGVRLWTCSVDTAWQPQAVFHDFGFKATDAGNIAEWTHFVHPRGRYCAMWVTDGAATFKPAQTMGRYQSISPATTAAILTYPAQGGSGSGSTGATNLTNFVVGVNAYPISQVIMVRRA